MLCQYGSKILRKLNGYLLRTRAEPGNWFLWFMCHTSWLTAASRAFASAAGAAVLCYYRCEMLKTVNRYLLRLGGSFFVGKQLVRQLLAGNRVSLLCCCSAVLCQALTNHREMYQASTGYTCTVCDVSHIHAHFSLWSMASPRYKYVYIAP